MIRNAVLHLTGEQPLLADLYGLPTASDAGLVCTNVRTTDGKRPIFIDDSSSTFFFPYLVIRFIEIPAGAVVRGPAGDSPGGEPADADRLPVPVTAGPEADGGDPELEIDEGLMQRIRDI